MQFQSEYPDKNVRAATLEMLKELKIKSAFFKNRFIWNEMEKIVEDLLSDCETRVGESGLELMMSFLGLRP